MGGEGGFRPTASPGLHGQRCHACHSRCPEEGDLAEQEAVLSSGVTQHHRAVCVLDPRPPISRGAALAGGGQGMLMGPQFPHLQKGANSGFLTEQLGRLNETQPVTLTAENTASGLSTSSSTQDEDRTEGPCQTTPEHSHVLST